MELVRNNQLKRLRTLTDSDEDDLFSTSKREDSFLDDFDILTPVPVSSSSANNSLNTTDTNSSIGMLL